MPTRRTARPTSANAGTRRVAGHRRPGRPMDHAGARPRRENSDQRDLSQGATGGIPPSHTPAEFTLTPTGFCCAASANREEPPDTGSARREIHTDRHSAARGGSPHEEREACGASRGESVRHGAPPLCFRPRGAREGGGRARHQHDTAALTGDRRPVHATPQGRRSVGEYQKKRNSRIRKSAPKIAFSCHTSNCTPGLSIHYRDGRPRNAADVAQNCRPTAAHAGRSEFADIQEN